MAALFAHTQTLAYPLLRLTMGVILLWIGALKFADPSAVLGLLGASLPFLAFPAFVYLLGAVEIVVALTLFAGFQVKWAGLALLGLFAGTLLIFLVAPKVTYGDAGFPYLSLVGEFLLKDLVLFAASLTLTALATAEEANRHPAPAAARQRLA